MSTDHHNFFDLRRMTLIQLWAAARDAGYALAWSPALRRVVMRPLEVRA